MKKLIIILVCFCTLHSYKAQVSDGPGRTYLEPTAEIKKLEIQESALKMSGDIQALATNRLAQIAAWEKISPEYAAEFGPITIDQSANNSITGSSIFSADTPRSPVGKYGPDVQINNSFVNDGVDMETALNGDIYVCSFINKVQYGGNFDEIYIYKSTNKGASFFLWGTANVPDAMLKMKLSLMDKGATKFLFVTYNSVARNLKTLRFNMAGGPLSSETIATGIKDFDIDVDYEFSAAAQLYAVYIKSNDGLYSARSAGNSTGFGWGDEHPFNVVAKECAFTYGKGSTFVSYVGLFTGNYYFAANSGYNTPTGWQPFRILEEGTQRETQYTTLRAERKPLSDYKVYSMASGKPFNVAAPWSGVVKQITSAGIATNIINASGFNFNSIMSWDSWAQKADGSTMIKASFVIQNVRILAVGNYSNGTAVYNTEVADHSALSFPHGSAVAGDLHGNSLAVYCSGTEPWGIFFDSDRPALGVEEGVKSSFSFYPNPVESTLTFKAKAKITSLLIYNISGHKIRTFKPDSNSSAINLSDLIEGTYIMQVNIDGVAESHKIIKK